MDNLHTHNGIDSPQIKGSAIFNAPQSALTASIGGTADATYSSNEQNIINNLITRVDELEAKLQALLLLR